MGGGVNSEESLVYYRVKGRKGDMGINFPPLAFGVFQIPFLLRILLKQNTALLSTVRPLVYRRDISHFPHKGINAISIIRGPIIPYIF